MALPLLSACLHWPVQNTDRSTASYPHALAAESGAALQDYLDVGRGQTFLISDEVATPGVFIYLQFLARLVRSSPTTAVSPVASNVGGSEPLVDGAGVKWKSVLVGHADTYKTYASAARKMGVNLATATMKGRFDFVDANAIVAEHLVPQDFPGLPSCGVSSWTARLLEVIEIRATTNNARPCIVLDDVSFPLYLGASVSDVVAYVYAVKAIVEKHAGLLIILCHHDTGASPLGAVEDDSRTKDPPSVEYNKLLLSMMRRIAHVIFQVEPLGVTRGVDGQITIIRGPRLCEIHGYGIARANVKSTDASCRDVSAEENTLFKLSEELKPNVIHYKLMDNQVKMSLRGYSDGLL